MSEMSQKNEVVNERDMADVSRAHIPHIFLYCPKVLQKVRTSPLTAVS